MSTARFRDLSIDASDPGPMAAFWGAVLGLRVHAHDDGDADLTGDRPQQRVWVTCVPEPRTAKNRVHLDVRARAVDDVLALGATRVSAPGEFAWTVLADPEGNRFCVFEGDDVPAYRLKDVVVDVADPARLAAWWAGVLGAEAVDDDGYSYVHAVPGAPFEDLDLVPVPDARAGKNRLHWDVDTDNVEALVAAGARVLRRPGDDICWTVLADPEGNEFCAFTP